MISKLTIKDRRFLKENRISLALVKAMFRAGLTMKELYKLHEDNKKEVQRIFEYDLDLAIL